MESYRSYSITDLRRVCQATAPNPERETKIGRFSRVFSIYLTWLLARTNMTPNQISILGAVVCLASAFTYFSNDMRVMLLGPVLYFLSIMFDGADGEIARLKKLFSNVGGNFVEPVIHDILYGTFFLIIAVALFLQTGNIVILYAGMAASIAKLLYRLLEIRFWNVVYAGTDMEKKETQNADFAQRSFLRRQFDFWNRNLFSYPAIVGPMLVATVANRMDLFIYFYALGFLGLLALLFFKQVRHFATR